MKPKILLVDDEIENLTLLQELLSEEYQLMFAKSGADALVFAARMPDLILLDIMMPEMDGYEVCRRLKADENTQAIPVIFVTAKRQIEDEIKGFAAGAVDYITKPISPPIVKARVRTHLNIRQAEAHIRKLNHNLEQSNRFIRNTFARYMSDEVVERILDNPDELRLEGVAKEITIMMTDLRGFTALSKNLPPATLFSVLNMYLDIMTEIILAHGGTIIEFLGDGILVLFGAPITRQDDAQRAVACALQMQLAMTDVNARNRVRGYPELQMGIGINSGEVVVGSIGSDKRCKYGVVGTPINLTARIESYTVGGQILIAESTAQICHPLLRIDDQFEIRPKGIAHAITIHQVGGIGGPYNVHLPVPVEPNYHDVADALAVRFAVMEGKGSGDLNLQGRIIRLSVDGGEIRTDTTAERLANIKIALYQDGREITRELFAKVIRENAIPSSMRVAFTSVPPAAKRIFAEILNAPDEKRQTP